MIGEGEGLGPEPSSDLAVLAPHRGTPDPRLVYLAGLGSAKSRRTMAGALERVAATIAELGEQPMTAARLPWHELRYEHTSAIRAALCARFAPATVDQALAALRGVLREACRLELISAEDLGRACDLKPARGTKLPAGRALLLSEIGALLGACDLSLAAGARDAALVAVIYGCGLRRAEAVTLDLADYVVGEQQVTIRGKGNKERTGYVIAGAPYLEAWLGHRGQLPGPLFLPVDKGGRIGVRRLGDQAVWFLFQRLAKVAGVALFSPHDLRRTVIGDLLSAGADLSVVQKLVGHADANTTAAYDRRGEATKKGAAGLVTLPKPKSEPKS